MKSGEPALRYFFLLHVSVVVANVGLHAEKPMACVVHAVAVYFFVRAGGRGAVSFGDLVPPK